MEYEFFDPTNQTHMELVNMVMQMESMPEFSEIPPPSVIDFSGGSMPSHAFRGGAPPSATMLPPVVANPSSTNSSVGGQAATVHNNSYPSANCGGINTTRLGGGGDVNRASIATMREMIFRIAAMQPVHIDPEAVKPPKRRNVKISKDPQSVAARHRRERISERIRILQRLVPGGTKMDTASMLDEAIHYVKFLKTQVQSLERVAANRSNGIAGGFSGPENYWLCGHHHHHHQSTYQ